MDEKRSAERFSIQIPVQIRNPETKPEPAFEVTTQNLHTQGASVKCSSWEQDGVCPLCVSAQETERRRNSKDHFQNFRNSFKIGQWIEIRGLNNVEGWGKEKKVLARIAWSRAKNDNHQIEMGLEFNRPMPEVVFDPVRPATFFGQRSPARKLPVLNDVDLNEEYRGQLKKLTDLIGGERKTGLTRAGTKKRALFVDEDKISTLYLFNLIEQMNFTAKRVLEKKEILKELKANDVDVVFFNPILNGRSELALISEIKEKSPATKVVLLAAQENETAVLDDPLVRLSDSIFVKPLELKRIYDFLKGFK